jgi:hypothetical protein
LKTPPPPSIIDFTPSYFDPPLPPPLHPNQDLSDQPADENFEVALEADAGIANPNTNSTLNQQNAERLHREVRTVAIPGGFEETLLSQVGKSIFKKSKKSMSASKLQL